MGLLLWTVAWSTLAIYLFLILMIRLIGRRMLAQLSAIDLIVVILLGSAVETAMVHASTSFKAGLVSAGVLLVANKLLTLAMLRSSRWRHLIGGGPQLLILNGEMQHARMDRLGFTEEAVMAALREREVDDVAKVRFAIFEPDGRVNVVLRDQRVAS